MQTLNILPRITTSFWKPNTEIKRYMKILKTISFFILLLFSANLQSQTFSACVEGTISVYGDAELSLCQGDGLGPHLRPGCRVNKRRRRLFKHFLVATLNGAFALV